MQRVPFSQLQRISDYISFLPHQSPTKSPTRALSPLRRSPFRRQTPMSPIRARRFQRSITPTKPNKRLQFTNTQLNTYENFDMDLMQKTIKSGIGLFQQISNQYKLASQRKQNKLIPNHLYLLQNSDKKKEIFRKSQNHSFSNKILNVKEIQSIHASKFQNNGNQFYFKTIQPSKPHSQYNIISQDNAHKQNIKPSQILNSFGNLKTTQNLQFNNFSKKSIKTLQIKPQYQLSSQKKKIETISDQPQKTSNPQTISSFQDILLLIQKASQKQTDQLNGAEEDVRVSFSDDKDSIIFNMNPSI